ncbi:MAG: thiol reductase thioredoxin [Deltaproteobacteria bacterium]|nr:MAG: thiol reductase thioredoxin [Deltaproteobacteria bacterium]
MKQDSVIIRCSSCGTKNRVPKGRLKDRPVCGKCKATLKLETVIIQCSDCGVKNRVFKVLLDDEPKCGKCHSALKAIPYYNHPILITDQTFNQEVLAFPGPVLMEYYSPLCAYCKTLDPILGQLALQYAGRLKIGKMNIEQNPLTASQYDIMSTPTMILFKNGKQINKLLGAVSKEEIEDHLRHIL